MRSTVTLCCCCCCCIFTCKSTNKSKCHELLLLSALFCCAWKRKRARAASLHFTVRAWRGRRGVWCRNVTAREHRGISFTSQVSCAKGGSKRPKRVWRHALWHDAFCRVSQFTGLASKRTRVNEATWEADGARRGHALTGVWLCSQRRAPLPIQLRRRRPSKQRTGVRTLRGRPEVSYFNPRFLKFKTSWAVRSYSLLQWGERVKTSSPLPGRVHWTAILTPLKSKWSSPTTPPALHISSCCHTRRWRFLCRARWSEREKLRSQSGHWNGLTPVCLRKCLVSSSERANFHVQPSHMHL